MAATGGFQKIKAIKVWRVPIGLREWRTDAGSARHINAPLMKAGYAIYSKVCLALAEEILSEADLLSSQVSKDII